MQGKKKKQHRVRRKGHIRTATESPIESKSLHTDESNCAPVSLSALQMNCLSKISRS